jgi:GTP-binding protein HflX
VAQRSRARNSQFHDAPREARARQRAIAIASQPAAEDLAELGELLRTAGVAVVGELVQQREQPHPNSYLGSGKLEELKALAAALSKPSGTGAQM